LSIPTPNDGDEAAVDEERQNETLEVTRPTEDSAQRLPHWTILNKAKNPTQGKGK